MVLKSVGKAWSGLIWLGIRTDGGLFSDHGNGYSGSIKKMGNLSTEELDICSWAALHDGKLVSRCTCKYVQYRSPHGIRRYSLQLSDCHLKTHFLLIYLLKIYNIFRRHNNMIYLLNFNITYIFTLLHVSTPMSHLQA